MNADTSLCFIQATQRVFHDMLGLEITQRDKPHVLKSHAPRHSVTAVISMSGEESQGIVALSMSRLIAIRLTEVLIEERPPEINQDVVDAIGEMINIISGNVRARLSNSHFSANVPTVIVGKSQIIKFPSSWERVSIPFGCLFGDLSIDYAFSPAKTEQVAMA